MRTDRLQREYALSIRWTAFPLHPEIPDEGMELKDLFAGRNVDMDAVGRRLRETAEGLGLPLGPRQRTYNSRRAQELAKWADDKGRGDPFRAAVFRAYFAEGRNIADPDELAAAVQAAGLDPAEARDALQSGSYGDAVDSDWARCRALGLRGVPSFLAGGRSTVGFPDYGELSGLAEGAGARRRASS